MRTVRKEPPVPSFQVQRAEFLDVLQFRGEVKALKSVTISAPPDVGMLQIVKIAADGSAVKQGDVVVEFDPSKTKTDLRDGQVSAEVRRSGDRTGARAGAIDARRKTRPPS